MSPLHSRLCTVLVVSAFSAMAHGQQLRADMLERAQCFGRFCISLPPSIVRVREEHEIEEITIEEKRWHNPLKKERSNEFESRLRQIQALAGSPSGASGVQGTILERRSFEQPKMSGAVYQRYDNPFIATWGALLAKGPVDAWFQIDRDLTAAREWPRRLFEVAGAYRVNETNPEAMRSGGLFYLRFGALALPYKIMERSDVYFEHPELQLTLEISSATVNEAKPASLQERLAANSRQLAGSSLAGVLQKTHNRLVAGMLGEEQITRTEAAGGQTLNFKWSYAGDPRSELKPRMEISMHGSSQREAEKQAFWNRLLDSLRPAASSAAPL